MPVLITINFLTIFLIFFKAYYAYDNEDSSQKKKEPVYNEELGLAIEKLKDGFQLKNLWDILSG